MRSQFPRLGELAFDSDRKLMSTLHRVNGKPMLLTKGAMDVLLARSEKLLTAKGVVPLTDEMRTAIARANEEFSENGLRVLAFACREMDAERELTLEDENGFTFVGLVCMIDPPREESKQAVADAKRGGIRTCLLYTSPSPRD